jgi:hypothetical protein
MTKGGVHTGGTSGCRDGAVNCAEGANVTLTNGLIYGNGHFGMIVNGTGTVHNASGTQFKQTRCRWRSHGEL